jgi:hypothetical protein
MGPDQELSARESPGSDADVHLAELDAVGAHHRQGIRELAWSSLKTNKSSRLRLRERRRAQDLDGACLRSRRAHAVEVDHSAGRGLASRLTGVEVERLAAPRVLGAQPPGLGRGDHVGVGDAARQDGNATRTESALVAVDVQEDLGPVRSGVPATS